MPPRFTIDWFPLLPLDAIALVALVLSALVAWGSWILARKQVPRRSIVVLAVLRAAAVLLFVACLLQPVVSYFGSHTQEPELIVLVDASASMGQVDSPNGGTRLQVATAAIKNSKLLDELGRKFDVKLFTFDHRAYPLDSVEMSAPSAAGATTDYAASFAAAGDLLAAESDGGSPADSPRRVLLVSDGLDHGDENFAAAAERAGAIVDVLPVGQARSSGPDAVGIADVQAPSRVLLASETKFVATLRRSDDGAAQYVVTLFEDDQEQSQQEVEFAAESRERQVTIAHRPTETGLKHYEFELRAKNQPAGAAAAEVERYGVDVQVIDDKVEVLILEDRWRWEFKYLKRVLEDDPSFNLTALLARGSGAFLQMGEPEAKADLGAFPQNRAEIDRFDCIVLGDVRPTRWPAGLSGALADAVIEDGKSLIMVAGPSLGELAQIAELQSLLPVELSVDSAAPVEGPLEVRLTPDGAASGLFADGGRVGTAAMPSVDRIYAPLRKKPAASVLVEAASKANTSGPLILVAEQTVGRGRVLFIGTDALWKWQTLPAADEDGRTPYEKLWQQALRAFTPHRTSGMPLRLVTARSRYEAGERVVLHAQIPAGDGDQNKLEATVVLPDKRRLPLSLEPDPSTAGMATATFDAVAPGRYRITATTTAAGRPVAQASTAVVVVASGGEADDRGVDHAALAKIAARTGGQVVDLADARSWPTPGERPVSVVEERRSINLWDDFVLLTLLCLVLGADWLLRLLRGYV
ncbi:MAG: VWA domain-containing protein [Planctomycetia bacterium]|nr:VWA domain-containing protein [Planctomycetia bacterium]